MMQVRDVLQVVSSRLLVPLFMIGTLLLAAGRGRISGELLPIAVVLVALLAPVAPTVSQDGVCSVTHLLASGNQ